MGCNCHFADCNTGFYFGCGGPCGQTVTRNKSYPATDGTTG